MDLTRVISSSAVLATLMFSTTLFSQTPGYFKDIFSDGGVNLTSNMYMDAIELLGLSVEYFATSDVVTQTEVMISDEMDTNGHLLYPDGAPRFRMIYTHGGTAGNHGYSLGEIGRDRVRTFYANGGSYAGSCAGAYIASLHYEETWLHPPYYHIWPGRTHSTGILDSYTGHHIPADSPLLDYFDFGNDFYVANVRHNGGCWARENLDFPSNTEVLTRYDAHQLSLDMHQKASTWAYKPDTTQGRIVVTGSHPETAWAGERLNMMQAILLYALDGVGNPTVKASLENGESRTMDLYAEDSLPAYTRIGDKQYHHFTISLPPGTSDLNIELDVEAGFAFNLYANPGSFAFEDSALYESLNGGTNHILNISPEESGLWFIGVECATTVDDFYYSYSGQTEVLNGVGYDITATWNTVGVDGRMASPSSFALYPNYPNPFNPSTSINYELPDAGWVSLVVYDMNGRETARIIDEPAIGGSHSVTWLAQDQYGKSLEAGIYLYEMNFTGSRGEQFREVRKFTLLK